MNCKKSRVERNQMPLTRNFSIAAVLALLSPLALAADLQKLDVASLPGDRLEPELPFYVPGTSTPKGYPTVQPARIAIDPSRVQNRLGDRCRELGLGITGSLEVVDANDRPRLL